MRSGGGSALYTKHIHINVSIYRHGHVCTHIYILYFLLKEQNSSLPHCCYSPSSNCSSHCWNAAVEPFFFQFIILQRCWMLIFSSFLSNSLWMCKCRLSLLHSIYLSVQTHAQIHKYKCYIKCQSTRTLSDYKNVFSPEYFSV